MNLLKRGHILIMLSLVVASTAPAFSPEARGTAMGGAYSSFAEGAEGMWWNPGSLAAPLLSSGLLGFGLEGGNNALSLSRIMGIISDSETDKRKAVEDVRKEGVWNAAVVGVGGVAATVKGIGIGVFSQAYVTAKDVTPDAVEFALLPSVALVPGKHYKFAGEYQRSVFTEIGAGYAREIVGLIPGLSISAGGALKFYIGHDYEFSRTLQEFDLGSPTLPISESERREATSGNGFGVDLGLHVKALGSLSGSIVVKNIASEIKWSDAVIEKGTFDQNTLAFIPTITTGDVTQEIPTLLLIGAGGSVPVVGTSVGAEVEVNTTDSETRVHLGIGQKFFSVLALRGGFVTKAGASPSMVTFGVGLGALVFSFDVGGGVALDGKGGSLAASGSLNF